MKNFIIIIIISLVLITTIILYNLFKYKPDYSYIINNEPTQLNSNQEKFKLRNFEITKIKKYEIEARILSIKEYSKRKDSDLMTYDLALGWKEMSDIKYLENINISQRNRWYYWRTKNNNLALYKIEHNSSNHHIIHSNDIIKEKLSELNNHQVIKMKGYLVNAIHLEDKKIKLNSSISRTDTGAGACEILYVENIEVIN